MQAPRSSSSPSLAQSLPGSPPSRRCPAWFAGLSALLLGLTVSLAAQVAWAQDDRFQPVPGVPYNISADQVVYEQERDLYELDGNVRVSQQGRVLTANWLIFSAQTNVGVASGDVVIRDGSDVIRAEFAWVDLIEVRILAEQATVDAAAPGFFITSDEIEKLGPDAYRIDRGMFTTCRCPPGKGRRPWEITASSTNLTMGGYAVAKNVTFRTLGVPILYTPYFIFPVKTERQSGFLIPSVGTSSRGGTDIRTPFFWAVRDDVNLTLTPIYMAKRGVKLDADLEYVFGEEGYGEGGFAVLPGDDEIDEGDPTERFSDDRYAFWLRHEQPLGAGTRFGADLRRISDNQFLLDFDNFGQRLESARFLESSAWLTRFREGMYTGIEATLLDDLQSPNDLDRDDAFLQRLPDVNVNLMPRTLSFGETVLRGALDFRYTYYYQKDELDELRGNRPVNGQFFDTGPDGLFDQDEPNRAGIFNGADNSADNGNRPRGGEGDGIFQPGELLADRGHRVDVYPRLALPFQWGGIETLSEVGYRDTLYFAEEAGSDHRGIVTGRIDARMRVSRDFQLGDVGLRHQIEPRIGFTYLNAQDQTGNPLFVPAASIRAERLIDADPRLLLRNPTDRVDDARFLNFAISNRIFGSALLPGAAPRELAEFRVGGGYDFLDKRPSNVFLDAALTPNPNVRVSADLGYDPKETRVEEALVSLFVAGDLGSSSRQTSAVVSYNYVRDRASVFENFLRDDDAFERFERNLERINQVNIAGNWAVANRLDLFLGGFLSFEETSTRNGSLGFRFYSACDCWQFIGMVQKRLRPDETRLMFEIRLSGLGRETGTQSLAPQFFR